MTHVRPRSLAMYSTDPEKPPKKPVIPSALVALAEASRWLKENHLEALKDADGLVWHLAVKVEQVADPADPKGLLWQIKVMPRCRVGAGELTATGTLDAGADARMLGLIGE